MPRGEHRSSDWPVSEERPTLPTPPNTELADADGEVQFDSDARAPNDTIPAPPPLPADVDEG